MHRIIGRRKTAVAILKTGRKNGVFINGRECSEYFNQERMFEVVNKVLNVARILKETDNIKVDLNYEIKVLGSGLNSQAQAVQLAIARHLATIDPLLRTKLQTLKLMKYDPRQVERKKCGLLKARKSTPFVRR